MSYWIDTHCHMNEAVYRDRFDEYMQRAAEMNVGRSNLICLNKEEYLYSLELAEKYPNLDVSFGYYPEDADHISAEDLDYLESQADRLRAIGEIGLNYNEGADREKQKQLFIAQIEIANRHHKPILIHCRDAVQDCYDILKKYAKTRILMHCFSESAEMMQAFLQMGAYLSFSGVATFKNAVHVRNNSTFCRLDRLMIETDCPYLTPVPHRGKMNETAYVAYTGKAIAGYRNMDESELQQQLMENYRRFFDEETD